MMTSRLLILFVALLAMFVYLKGTHGNPSVIQSNTELSPPVPVQPETGPLHERVVRQAAPSPLASLLPVLLLLLDEASKSGGGGGGLAGILGGGGGRSWDRRRSGSRGKRESLAQLRTLLETNGEEITAASQVEQMKMLRSLPSTLRFINDKSWTEIIPILRKLQSKTFLSANPELVVPHAPAAKECGNPVVHTTATAGPPVFG
ncbi:hypothetical protein BV898_05327 [Hypsibius exemplaris]|uniref:Uncharacterized protein n=1 Tax=Hypsibius exemplaris TaxID=2072580 RepID=A0A1W0WZW3_HYPEX|nr:hypothetical protein BV898_05327 [Hypsibius exemplaris]